MSKNTRNRIILTAVAALLLVAVAVGGTIAYLQDSTDTVTNTFTPSTLNIDIEETLQSDNTPLGDDVWSAQVIPGATLYKDPKVTVYAHEDNVKMYLFIEVDSVATINSMVSTGVFADPTMFYETTSPYTWTALSSNANVYWTVLDPVTTDNVVIELISGNALTVNANATQNHINTLFADGNDITLSFTAYACQYLTFEDDPESAWDVAEIAGKYPTT